MNELIERLAEQCTTIYNSTTFPVDKDFNYEKFARLIAAECARICYDEDYTSGSGYARAITKRFGVAE
jgi:hypothetical protein